MKWAASTKALEPARIVLENESTNGMDNMVSKAFGYTLLAALCGVIMWSASSGVHEQVWWEMG